MARHGKKYRAAAELVHKAGQVQNLADAVKLVKQTARAKFDETIVVLVELVYGFLSHSCHKA